MAPEDHEPPDRDRGERDGEADEGRPEEPGNQMMAAAPKIARFVSRSRRSMTTESRACAPPAVAHGRSGPSRRMVDRPSTVAGMYPRPTTVVARSSLTQPMPFSVSDAAVWILTLRAVSALQ